MSRQLKALSSRLPDLEAHEARLKDQGIAVLPKPFDIQNLYRRVEEALLMRPGRS